MNYTFSPASILVIIYQCITLATSSREPNRTGIFANLHSNLPMALQIPFIPQFKHQKTSFNHFIRALYITDKGRKKALLMHLLGPEAQKIYGSLNKTKSAS